MANQSYHQAAVACSRELTDNLLENNDAATIKNLEDLVKLINTQSVFDQKNLKLSQEILNSLPAEFDYIKQKMTVAVNNTITETGSALKSIASLKKSTEALHNAIINSNSDQKDQLEKTKHQIDVLLADLTTNVNTILIHQSYQDLCGQVINRTHNNVNNIVGLLGRLIMLSQLPSVIEEDLMAGVGPTTNEDNSINQDDIDDLFN